MNRIALLRKEKNMSQVALSLKLNVSQKMVSAYENGKSEPGIETLKRLAEIFETSVDYLIGCTDIRNPVERIYSDELTNTEREIIREVRLLSPDKQKIALGIIIGIKKLSVKNAA